MPGKKQFGCEYEVQETFHLAQESVTTIIS